MTQNFLNSVPQKCIYVLPDDHQLRAYNPILTARDIQRIISNKIPVSDTDHCLEMLQFYEQMISEFENVAAIKQAHHLLPGGDFRTHHCVLDKYSLFYLLRDCNVPGVPYERSRIPSYDNMLRLILTR